MGWYSGDEVVNSATVLFDQDGTHAAFVVSCPLFVIYFLQVLLLELLAVLLENE